MEFEKSNINQWILAMWANIPLLMYGMIVGWMSPAAALLQSENSPSGYPVSDTIISWMASSMALVASVVVFIFSWITDRYGRKFAIVSLSLPGLISVALKFLPEYLPCLILSSMIFGILGGGCYVVIPIYIREISENSIRGTLVSLTMFVQNIGILITYIMGATLNYYTILAIIIVVPFIHLMFAQRAPESPVYSVKIGNIEEATRTLAWLRGTNIKSKEIEAEIDDIRSNNMTSSKEIKLSEILSKNSNRRGLFICLVLIFVQSAGGCFAVITYAGTILSNTDIDANLQAIAIAVVLIGGAAFAVITVDRFGRKILFVVSSIMISLSMLTFGVVLTFKHLGISPPPSWIPIVALTVAIFSYGFGTSPLPLVVMSEMFSFQVRSKLSSIINSYAWMITFATLIMFKSLVNLIGLHQLFYVFAGINMFGAFFSLIWLPETKGKSVEQIETLLIKK